MGISDDEFAAELLWAGWFDFDMEPDRRTRARENFFLYTGLAKWDFDWDQWKDWYEERGWYAAI